MYMSARGLFSGILYCKKHLGEYCQRLFSGSMQQGASQCCLGSFFNIQSSGKPFVFKVQSFLVNSKARDKYLVKLSVFKVQG